MDGRQLKLDLAGPSVHEGEWLWEYAVMVADAAYPIEAIGQQRQGTEKKAGPKARLFWFI